MKYFHKKFKFFLTFMLYNFLVRMLQHFQKKKFFAMKT